MIDATLFSQVVRLVTSNDAIFAELYGLDHKITRALAYGADPDNNPAFAADYVNHLMARRSACLARLAANRAETGRILGLLDGEHAA